MQVGIADIARSDAQFTYQDGEEVRTRHACPAAPTALPSLLYLLYHCCRPHHAQVPLAPRHLEGLPVPPALAHTMRFPVPERA